MHKATCFGLHYNTKAKECQVCEDVIDCWEEWSALSRKSVITTGYGVSILNIISQGGKVTVNEIKDVLKERFADKELNVYYYLGNLKKSGMVNVEIKGRQRFYSVR